MRLSHRTWLILTALKWLNVVVALLAVALVVREWLRWGRTGPGLIPATWWFKQMLVLSSLCGDRMAVL